MFETTVQLKPREQWRPGMTAQKLRVELDDAVKLPGLSNLWVPPIRNRVDMLATGVKSPIGIKVSGADLAAIDRSPERIAVLARGVAGVSSALAGHLGGGRYLDIDIDRAAAGRAGMSISDLQAIVWREIGGEAMGEVLAPGAGIEGRAFYSINLRCPDARRHGQRATAVPAGGAGGDGGVVAQAGLSPGRRGADFSREIDELAETRRPTPTTRA